MLAHRLLIPDGVRAILWDMDGVLLDTLTFDYQLCNQLLRSCADGTSSSRGQRFATTSHMIASSGGGWWNRPAWNRRPAAGSIVEGRSSPATNRLAAMRPWSEHEGMRESWQPPGRRVSNRRSSRTTPAEVREMVHRAGLLGHFDHVVGNDLAGIAKPARIVSCWRPRCSTSIRSAAPSSKTRFRRRSRSAGGMLHRGCGDRRCRVDALVTSPPRQRLLSRVLGEHRPDSGGETSPETDRHAERLREPRDRAHRLADGLCPPTGMEPRQLVRMGQCLGQAWRNFPGAATRGPSSG